MPALRVPSGPLTTRVAVAAIAALLVAAAVPPLAGAGTPDAPEVDDPCGDAGIGPLSAVPRRIADVDRAWWVHDTGGSTLELHMRLCTDGPEADRRRALERVVWSVLWTDPSGIDWKAKLWLDGEGQPGSERLRLCTTGQDVTDREGGFAEVRREAGDTRHWILEIDNSAETTGFIGTLTDLVIWGGQYVRSTSCFRGMEPHDRAPDDGVGAPFSLQHADLHPGPLEVSPGDALVGDEVTFSTTVENDGSNRSEAFDVAFLVDDATQSTVRVDPLDTGASREVTSEVWTATGGHHEIRAVVDAGDEITEVDEDDNVVGTNVTIPAVEGRDLEVFDVERTPSPTIEGDETEFTARVRNRGTNATGPTTLVFDLDGDRLDEVSLPALDTYEVAELTSGNWTAALGNHTIRATADPDDAVDEVNESNNAMASTFEVISPPPNLDLADLATDPAVPGPGDQTVARATVVNEGETASDPSVVRFHLDGDLLGEESLPSLDPGESASVSSSAWSFDDVGEHTVRAVVDPDDGIVEGDETDNEREIAFTVRTWPSIGRADIRPGVVLEMGGSQCTAAFVFSSPDNGTLYVATASHCVGGFDLGDPVSVGGHSGAGVVAYCSWMHTEGADRCPSGDGFVIHPNDFALIRIRDQYRRWVHPAMLHFGGPTGVVHGAGFGDRVLTYGNSGLRPGDPADPREGIVWSRSGWTTTTYFAPPSIPGDSGSPSIATDGQAVGVLSGLAPLPPGANTWVNLDDAVGYAEDHSDLEVELETWPMLRASLLPG